MKYVLIIIGALVGLGYAIRREIIAREKKERGENDWGENPKPHVFGLFILINMVWGGFVGWLLYLFFS